MKSFFKTLLASILGFIIGMILLIFIFAAVISSVAKSDKISVKENTVLELNLNGEIPERNPEENPFAGLQDIQGIKMNITLGLRGIMDGLENAANDPKIKGVYLRTDLYSGGLATAEEIRNQIIKFRKSGKFVVSYSEVLTETGYFIASACDKVYLNPKGMVEFNGFSGKVTFFKGLLDKMGIEMEVFKAGKYKGAVEPFVQTSLSEPNREQIRTYVFELFGHHIKSISQSRNIDSAVLAGIANNFLARTAKKALEYKLIDGLKYEDEVEDEIRGRLKLKAEEKFKPLAFEKYLKNSGEQKYHADKIAIIYGVGEINLGKDETGESIGSETVAAAIKKARLNKKVKAVVFRINSPGGSSNASDIIAREIELCRKVKPVIVSFGNVAASGGYYIACLGDSIFAYPNSITGSIGVFALVPNTSTIYKKHLGLTYETVPTGEFAEIWRPDQGLSAGMRQYFQEMVGEVYIDFISVVSKGRKLDTSSVAAIAEGHVYTAMAAKKLGLIDAYGGIQRAVQSAAWKAGIKDYMIVEYPLMKSPFELLFGDKTAENMTKEVLKTHLGELYAPFEKARKYKDLKGTLMLMPWEISIQ